MRTAWGFCALAVLLSVSFTSAGAEDDSAKINSLVQKTSPSIVTVKLVVKTQYKYNGQSRDQEYKMSMKGVAVTPGGLIMLSYTPFSSDRYNEAMKDRDTGAGSDYSMQVTPSSFKVLFSQDEKEYDAFLAATDAKLDLAFIQVEGLGDKKIPIVDFTNGATLSMGQQVLVVSRLGKGYDFAPYFSLARASCEISKPRKAWMLDGSISESGLPIFTINGEVAGVLTVVDSGVKDDSEYSYSGSESNDGMFVVPTGPIKALIDQAVKQAGDKAVERAKAKANPPAPTNPPAPKK